MSRAHRIVAVCLAGAAALGAFVYVAEHHRAPREGAFAAPGIAPLTALEAQVEFWRLTPALLLVVYKAFAETEENAIYDRLAQVTHGDALEYLYLERVGAMAGGGLDEADQIIHEIKLLETQVTRSPSGLSIDASWQVIGTVGHAEHMHVRGNTYRADLTVAPVEGAWRITEFTLLDVSREAAGEMFPAPPTN
jgi:hypothetical protein